MGRGVSGHARGGEERGGEGRGVRGHVREGRGARGHVRGGEGSEGAAMRGEWRECERLERRGARGSYTAKNKTTLIHAKKRGREE